MRGSDTVESLRSVLQQETQARKATQAALEAAEKTSKQQRKEFETWALALEQQVEANTQTLAKKLRELEAVKRQLELVSSLGKGEEKEAWARQQTEFEGELKRKDMERKAESEELRKALEHAEDECIAKDTQLKASKSELQLAKDSQQTKESTLTSQVISLTSQLSSLREEHSATLVLFTSEKAALEASRARSESEKSAAYEEIKRLQTTVSLLTTQLKSLQQENASLQELAKTQEVAKLKAVEDLRKEIDSLRSELADKGKDHNSALQEVAKWQQETKSRERLIDAMTAEQRLAADQQSQLRESLLCYHEEVRGYFLREEISPAMERYHRQLDEYRTQLGKCQVALTKYEQMIEVGSERLKSLDLVVQAREREVNILRGALTKHKVPVPAIPESSGLGGEMRGSFASKTSKKAQVTNDPCACNAF